MGSAANPTAWSPYDSYKDCSQGICSIYCPQWCYIIFPPPPPFEAQDDGDSGTNFSPLIIAVIGILGSAFLLVSYYTIISKYCKRRTNSDHQNSSNELEVNQNQVTHDQSQQQQQQVALNGLDESLIKSIAVFKYKKGDGLIEGTDCAVCLSEFEENESLRLLPKCSHAFHLPCIDTWLRSHSNCPLCRSNVVPILNLLPLQTSPSTTLNVSSLEMRRQGDLILVIDDRDRVHQEQVFDHVVGDSEERTSSMINQENEQEGDQEIRSRSFSLGSFSCQGNLLIADILNISDEELDLCEENCESQMGNSSVSTKRSNSRHDHKGKKLVLPN